MSMFKMHKQGDSLDSALEKGHSTVSHSPPTLHERRGSFRWIAREARESKHSPWMVIRRYPHIFIVPFLLFVLLFSASFALLFGLGDTGIGESEVQVQERVKAAALEGGEWFTERFQRALQPGFALSSVISSSPHFQSLPTRIGSAGADGALPFTFEGSTQRNVSDVCNKEDAEFRSLVTSILETTRMEAVVSTLQMAPQGVVCLVYSNEEVKSSDGNGEEAPQHVEAVERTNNTTNTDENDPESAAQNTGKIFSRYNKTSVVGTDLLSRSWNKWYVDALASEAVQVKTGGMGAVSGIRIIIPVKSETNTIEVEREMFDSWGFVELVVDWAGLIESNPVVKAMAVEDLPFRLYRTFSRKYQNLTATLVESPGYPQAKMGRKMLVQNLDLPHDDWAMEVAYEFTETKPWMRWATIVCVVLSFSIAMVTYLVLLHVQVQAIAENEKTALILESAKLSARKERELNEFLAHEVRNPVSAAISACTFVSSAVNETEPLTDQESIRCVRDDVNIIHTSLQFVNDLLRTMLDIHRADSKLLKVERCATDVRMDIFDPVACMLHQHESMYRVEVECPEGLVIETDRMRLKQIILNLGRNSSKFVEKGFVRLRAVVDDDSLFLYVEDSGPGIPEEKRHKLFKKFQDSLDSLNQGTGVGLHLCRSLVELMDGEIWLDESYHSGVEGCPGARFVVRLDGVVVLPSDSTATETLTSVSSDHELSDASHRRDDIGMQCVPSLFPSGHSDCRSLPVQFRVLFVDDDTVLRKLFVRAVKKVRSDWIIEEAASGEAALHMVETQTYDVIFVDQYMASVTKSLLGTEAVRALRANGVASIICGLSANDMEKPFLAAGADAFSMKPFPCTKDELTVELQRILYATQV